MFVRHSLKCRLLPFISFIFPQRLCAARSGHIHEQKLLTSQHPHNCIPCGREVSHILHQCRHFDGNDSPVSLLVLFCAPSHRVCLRKHDAWLGHLLGAAGCPSPPEHVTSRVILTNLRGEPTAGVLRAPPLLLGRARRRPGCASCRGSQSSVAAANAILSKWGNGKSHQEKQRKTQKTKKNHTVSPVVLQSAVPILHMGSSAHECPENAILGSFSHHFCQAVPAPNGLIF
eukprot:gene13790-biopygen23073